MEIERLAEITVKVTVNDECPKQFRDEPPRIYTMSGYVAEAFRKLHAAGRYGVHAKELRRDALARLKQLGVPFEVFSDRKLGTGNTMAWTRLTFPSIVDVTIVEGVA